MRASLAHRLGQIWTDPLGAPRRFAVGLYRRAFGNRNTVFRWGGPGAAAAGLPRIAATRLDGADALTDALCTRLAQAFGAPVLDEIAENFDRGATLWVGPAPEAPTVHLWTIEAGRLARWYIPLDPADTVIFSVATAAPVRGRRLAPALVLAALAELEPRGEVYLDTRVWNAAAQRSFAAAGFRRHSGPYRPLPRPARSGTS